MTGRAFTAIVTARLSAERRTVLYAAATAAVAGLALPREPVAPVFFSCAAAIVAALLQSPGRQAILDLCEESAPLFGRELARAKALAPCIVAAIATLAYCAPSIALRAPHALETVAIAMIAAPACALVALSASVREGAPRALYVALACTVAAGAYAIATAGASLSGELAFCALVAFVALRQYGEALARFDPV
ncbi:MAG: hypothetical protein JO029_15250 [Candidatus Eremiobacteraeota bacterium]|nr:hypothetical protein [Candidatus Eremiobacteraeota bacterium]MBV8332426.1 hypothetical protein [Candidatus Eremiobacteraeota bacterium]MBV8435635.1 hypothetical protein [Candidatus Eremiobacteraeota bacterium]MBV8656093.1 hypothetical protein [Candidatus Eremiobacteraeota bacterium]MBV8720954.1 hypothetical protein [Candidatus Eremiobacteraeota bacterium]